MISGGKSLIPTSQGKGWRGSLFKFFVLGKVVTWYFSKENFNKEVYVDVVLGAICELIFLIVNLLMQSTTCGWWEEINED